MEKVIKTKAIKKGVRLSNDIRHTISNALVDDRLATAKSDLEADRSSITAQIITSFDDQFKIALAELPLGLLPVSDNLQISTGKDKPLITFKLDGEYALPYEAHAAPAGVKVSPALREQIVSFKEDEKRHLQEAFKIGEKVSTFLAGFNSLKELLIQAPELSKYVPDEYFEDTAQVSLDDILAA